MKKAKNQTLEKTEVKTAEKEKINRSENNIAEKDPSDKLRSKEGGDGNFGFKKVLYGYDPDEVNSYIEELNKTYTAATRNYESRLSSIKEELRISNRERDSYSEKYRNSKPKHEETIVKTPEKTDKTEIEAYVSEIAGLKEKLEKAQAENLQLTEKAAVLERENSKISALEKKCDLLFADYKEATAQLETAKSEKAKCETELQAARQGLEEKTLEFIGLSARADDDKKKAAELEVKNGILGKQTEENEAEILRLKEINKAQAYEYADKVGQLESEHTKTKLTLQRELKLQDYYINQAEFTLSELAKQLEQIKESFSESRAE